MNAFQFNLKTTLLVVVLVPPVAWVINYFSKEMTKDLLRHKAEHQKGDKWNPSEPVKFLMVLLGLMLVQVN